MRTLFALAATAAALISGPVLAQTYGSGGDRYGPTPAYASPAYATSGYDYSRGRAYERGPGFTLAGARAGITVLGIDLDAGAGLRIGLNSGGRERHVERPAAYAPPPQPVYAEPAYETPTYEAPTYAPTPMSYAAPYAAYPCGCGGW